MSTIRGRLITRLLLGLALLLLLGSGTAYLTARRALLRQFDHALRTKAMALVNVTEMGWDSVRADLPENLKPEFEAGASRAFFQIWGTNDLVQDRSQSLRGASLPLRCGTLAAPRLWNLRLPTGAEGRAAGLRFQIMLQDEDQPPRPMEVALVLAVDRGDLDRALGALALVLAGLSTVVLSVTGVAMPRLLKRELAPLDRLAGQAQTINAASLAARFPTQDLPAELTPIAERLNDLMGRSEAAFEAERQFSHDLAHELRTPVAELLSLSEVALKWPDTRTADTDRTVHDIARRMATTIERLLTLARSGQGLTVIERRRFDMVALIEAVARNFEEQAARRQLAFKKELPAAFEIESDPLLLRLTLTNLVENAVEYSLPGGTVLITCEQKNGAFVVRVMNPVENLTAEDVPRLFDRFWRKDPARSSTAHAGLGLSLARAFADSLDCTLEAAMPACPRLVMTLAGPAELGPGDLPRSAGSPLSNLKRQSPEDEPQINCTNNLGLETKP